MCLRDKALGWFEGFTEDGVSTDDWDTVYAEFLETYEPKFSAEMTCANLTDLTQKLEETIIYYTCWVQMAYKRLTDKTLHQTISFAFSGFSLVTLNSTGQMK